jgi:hypothetical protein
LTKAARRTLDKLAAPRAVSQERTFRHHVHLWIVLDLQRWTFYAMHAAETILADVRQFDFFSNLFFEQTQPWSLLPVAAEQRPGKTSPPVAAPPLPPCAQPPHQRPLSTRPACSSPFSPFSAPFLRQSSSLYLHSTLQGQPSRARRCFSSCSSRCTCLATARCSRYAMHRVRLAPPTTALRLFKHQTFSNTKHKTFSNTKHQTRSFHRCCNNRMTAAWHSTCTATPCTATPSSRQSRRT